MPNHLPRLTALSAATRPPLSVGRESGLREAKTLMLLHDYSQLPVMHGERTVHGVISWKSIGRAHVCGEPGPTVADSMEPIVRILPSTTPLLTAVDEVIRHEFVLVRGPARKIVGLVTSTDLNVRLHDLTAAFLLVRNIELQIRRLLDDRFSRDVLRSTVAPDTTRTIDSVTDLTFGETLRLLGIPEHWACLGLKVDPATLLRRLDEVRMIRNAVMHFRSETVAERDIERLRATSDLLKSLKPCGATGVRNTRQTEARKKMAVAPMLGLTSAR